MENGWELVVNDDLSFDLFNEKTCVKLEGCLPRIETSGGTFVPDSSWDLTDGSGVLLYELPSKWRVNLRVVPNDERRVTVTSIIENTSAKDTAVNYFCPVTARKITCPAGFDRVVVNGKDMCEYSSLLGAPVHGGKSNTVAGFTDSDGNCSLVTGFSEPADAFYSFEFELQGGGVEKFNGCCDREGIILGAGRALTVSDMVIIAGQSLNAGMKEYAELTAEYMGSRTGETATGWCSWYYYYDYVRGEDIRENLDALKDSQLSGHVKYIQIDDGWNKESESSPRVWGDWHGGGLFGNDMKAAADEIKGKGFSPGLWLAPFSVDAASNFYKEHSEWLVQGDDGPANFFGAYALDLSREDVLDFVRETFERVFDEWGFEYVKIDFLLHAVLPGRRSRNDVTTAALLRRGLEVIREAAGERFILGCGCPMSPATGLVDGMRIGNDVSSRWYVPVNTEAWPCGNLNIKAAAVHTIWRNWMHRSWWQNDPDCLVVRDYGSRQEMENCMRHFPEFGQQPEFGLSDNEARCWAELVGFTGTMAIISENMTELKGPRREMLEGFFPPKQEAVDWVDWYGQPEAAVLKDSGSTRVGVFNLSDEEVQIKVPAERIIEGRKFVLVEAKSRDKLRPKEGVFIFILPARSSEVWKIKT